MVAILRESMPYAKYFPGRVMMNKSISALIFISFLLFNSFNALATTPVSTILPIDGASEDGLGHQVAISGDYIICGAAADNSDGDYSGAAYIYKRTGDNWIQTAILRPADGAPGRQFGSRVALDGDYAAVSALEPLQNTFQAGSVYIFQRSGETWSQTAKITPRTGEPQSFGGAISLCGDRLLIGEFADSDISGIMAGVAYIYERSGSTWSETARLLPSELALWDYFGMTVALSDDYALIAASFRDERGIRESGAVYVFKNNNGSWSQVGKLTDPSGGERSFFGDGIALYGNHAIISSISETGTQVTASIFAEDGGVWREVKKLTLPGPGDGPTSMNVSINDQYAMVGVSRMGVAYIYQNSAGNWTEIEQLSGSLNGIDENFGAAVACDNLSFVIGAPRFWDDNNPVRVYVYEKSLPAPPPATDYTYYLPGFNSESGNWTGIGLTNRDPSAPATVAAKIFSNAGTPLRVETLNISAGGQKSSAIGGGLAAKGWVQLEADSPLAGLCFIGSFGSNSAMADVPVTDTLENSLVVPHIAQDNTWDTTLMICNPNDNQNSLQIIYRDVTGTELARRNYSLPAFGGAVYPLAEIFSNLIPLAGSITLEANSGIAAFALYSNLKTGGTSFAGINAVTTQQ